jgi:hypothetical protein
MNSTMWRIALRTLARDAVYALRNVAELALVARDVTVALQPLKAARARAVRALRYE